MTSGKLQSAVDRRWDGEDDGGMERMGSGRGKERNTKNRIRKLASEQGRQPEGGALPVPEEVGDEVITMVKARKARETTPNSLDKKTKRKLFEAAGRVDGNQPAVLAQHRLDNGLSPGGGNLPDEPDAGKEKGQTGRSTVVFYE